MSGEWESVPLGELVQPGRAISYGIVQPGPHFKGGIPIVRVSDIREGRISTSAPLCVSPEIEAAYRRTRLKGGEMLLTLVGTVGESAVVPKTLGGWNTARAVAVIPVREDVGGYWLKLATQSPVVRELINGRLNTTVQATLNLRDVAELPISLPPRKERDRIIELLGSLDSKIELNRRMAETLEAMARALFKDWFVDFTPVYVKAADRPTGLPANLSALFTDEFGDDGLPANWRMGCFSELFEVVGGNTPSTQEPLFWGGRHSWATPKDLSALHSPVLLRTARNLSDAGLRQCSSGLLPISSLLLSSRAPIGYMAFLTQPTAINQGFAGIVKKKTSTTFAWAWCDANMQVIKGNANGSTFMEISKSTLRNLEILVPPEAVVEEFCKIADGLFERIILAVREQEALASLRDLLLPKLISGELRIADAEKRIAAA